MKWSSRLSDKELFQVRILVFQLVNKVCYTVYMKCRWKHCDKNLSGKQTAFCSINCKNKFYVSENRRSNKRKLVEHFGGKCVWCGYSKSYSALQFHHTDNNKEFGISADGMTRSLEKLIAEASKCVLICANCHAEHHGNQ